MSYHNLREMFLDDPRANEPAERFDQWLTQAVTDPDVQARERKLAAWRDAPGALDCHPRPEHLLPLMVAAGAAGSDQGKQTFNDRLIGKAVSGYQFG
jgi:aromatic ring-opening dioxygenase catalytic subunit (LigB family)